MKASRQKKIKDKYRREGWAQTLKWLVRKALSRVAEIYRSHLFVKSLEAPLPLPMAKIPLEIRQAGSKDMELFQQLRAPWKSWSKIIERRLAEGKICFFALHENHPVGYVWVSFTKDFEPNSGITVKSGDDGSYGFDLYVLPEYRRYLVGYELLGRWLQFSREMGRTRAFGLVAVENEPMRLTLKLVFGFKRAGNYTSIRFFGRRGLALPGVFQGR